MLVAYAFHARSAVRLAGTDTSYEDVPVCKTTQDHHSNMITYEVRNAEKD